MTTRVIFASPENTQKNLPNVQAALDQAEAILIGAGSGLSTAAGLTYSGERFEKHFKDFETKYHITDMYTGGFYPFPSREEFWAWWSRHIYINRYDLHPSKTYTDLLNLVKSKDYFVLTTNVDHQFQLAGFDKSRLFYTQGDYGLFQCAKPCHNKTYDNETIVRQMYQTQKDMKVPTALLLKCPVCGGPMTTNLRCDATFVEDDGWHAAAKRYHDWLTSHAGKRVVFLEVGVGHNTPQIIKYPFWRQTLQNEKAIYVSVNLDDSYCPEDIAARSICLDADINYVLQHLH